MKNDWMKWTLPLALLLGSTEGEADNWMARLPNDTYVALVSIPGTHDAATGCGWMEGYEDMGDSFARTQDLSIAEQWTAGIRAFDLRPCVYEDYMNLNHGIVPTSVHFEDVLCQLRDSLKENPTEFIVIHLLHEDDGDQIADVYNTRLMEILQRDDLKDYLARFKTDLTVKEMRGKMLILSRDNYGTPEVGGIMKNWTGEAIWSKQTNGRILGPDNEIGLLYMQDYSDTHNEGGIDTKVKAIQQMLDFSTKHQTASKSAIRWIYNFASAYSKVLDLFGMAISTSEGYRDNATHTHAAIIDYLNTHEAGPTGIILMDFAGVDNSQGYEVKGAQAIRAIIDNNFKYLQSTTRTDSPQARPGRITGYSSLSGMTSSSPQTGINIVQYENGSTKKYLR